MKNSSLTQWLCAALLVLGISAQAAEKSIHNMSVEDEVLVSVTATVQAVDAGKRELMLKGPLGNVETLTVDPAVKRLNEIKVGDEVTARYYVSIAGELREPTAEEKRNPLMIVEGAAKAPKSASPAAGGLRVIRVVATVEGLARPTRMVTLKGPRGKYMDVRARDVKRLEKLHLGDTVVVRFTEALAVSVEKAPQPRD